MHNIQHTFNENGELLRALKRFVKKSASYNFATAFFDLKVIGEYFSSLEEAIKRKSQVRFIFSNAVNKDDFLAIKTAKESEYSVFCKMDSVSLLDSIQKQKLFEWIKNDLISFRVIFNQNNGIFHGKLGYVETSEGEIIEWSGSANHTFNGLTSLNQEFVSISIGDTKSKTSISFDEAWEGKIKGTFVLSIDNVLATELISENQDNSFIDINWFKSKWKRAVILHNQRINVITDIDYTYAMPPGTQYDKNSNSYYIDVEGCNKLAILNWIKKNPDYYIPYATSSFLEDNIKKMTDLTTLGLKIKNEWSTIIESDDYKEFLEISSFLSRKPFELQMKQAFFAAKMNKSLNFSVPGTGKTMVSLTAFNYLQRKGNVNRMFVIAPTSAHKVWEEEFNDTFGYWPKTINLSDISGDSDLKWRIIDELNKHDYDLVIMHFATAYNYKNILKKVIKESDFLVIDEAHYIKNFEGEWGPAISEIGIKSKFSLMLTGTPAPNGIEDIYNILSITYGIPFMKFFRDSNEKEKLIAALHMKITYQDLEMKYKQLDNLEYYDFNQEQNKLRLQINEQMKFAGSNFLELLIRRMQNTTSPKLIEGRTFNVNESGKLKKLLEIIDPTKNIVIWANFQLSIESIYEAICKQFGNKEKIYKYYGKEDSGSRIKAIEDYKQNGGILIASPHTLAEAVSLHKQTDYTIYFEYSFNLIHWIQSRNRTFRFGIDKDMEYKILLTKDDPLDKKILEVLSRKEDFQESLISYNSKKSEDEIINEIKKFIWLEEK